MENITWSLGKTKGMEGHPSEQTSPEGSALLLAPPVAQVGSPRSHQLDLVPAHPRETRKKVFLMQDLQHSCSCHSLFFIDLLFWEQLLPSHFRFDSAGFSSLHLLTTCLQLLLLLL